LTVSNCTLSGNSASYGAGIYNNGASSGKATLSLKASTLSGNSAGGNGAGIYNDGESGTGTVQIANSTLIGNSAIKGGGGIFNDGTTLEIGSSILKAGAWGANIGNASGTVISDGYNLASDAGGGFLTGTADQINTDPMLGPLQDNGGPTFTHALLPGSPAIDKGNSFGDTTDLRGRMRPYDFPAIANASGGDGSDIGAFELNPPQLNIARSASNMVLTWSIHDTGCTLQSTTNPVSPAVWSTNSPAPVLIAGQNTVTSPITSAQKFYRLVQ